MGARARVRVPDFPSPGELTWFTWNQSTQHLEMAAVQTRSVDQSIVQYLTGPVGGGQVAGTDCGDYRLKRGSGPSRRPECANRACLRS